MQPDWTDHRGLLGFFNPITNQYVSTPFLDLLLRSSADVRAAEAEGRGPYPFCAILDEMNLARVEHYFADFLSCLESEEALVLHEDVATEIGEDIAGPAIPRKLTIPPNVFFTGTVNIDETTYMFSPKVLDRAFTIELNEVDLGALGGAAQALSAAALRLDRLPPTLVQPTRPSAADWRSLGELSEGELQARVVDIHDQLARTNRHFGYRVANEIGRYVALAAEQAGDSRRVLWAALDLALLQKVLPKFHGTQAEIEDVLTDLFALAVDAGERSWLIRGAPGDVDRAAAALAGVCRRLDGMLLKVDFGNAVGRFALAGGAIDVVSGKWTAAHFDQMLEELTAIAAGLPFTAGTGGALSYHRTHAARHDVLYHAFVYLRHIVLGSGTPAGTVEHGLGRPHGAPRPPLPAALAVILADPHRRWERDERTVPIERARDVDAHALFDAVLGKVPLLRLSDGIRATMPIARALRHHVPARVAERRIHASVDTAENRFVKAFLGLAEQVIDDMRESVEGRTASRRTGTTAFEQRIFADCDAMSHALAPAIRHPLWREVGPMTHMPAASTVLQRRRGYRDVMGHFARLRMATRLPLDPSAARELLEVKDIGLMYELWCYFKVAEAITARLGRPATARMWVASTFEIKVPGGEAVVEWPDGTRLLYNAGFSRGRPAGRRSYSVPLRPDIALHVPAGPNRGLHLLDAKFRLDGIGEVMPMDESAASEDGGEPADGIDGLPDRQGDYKRTDLYKMHAYRDAIPEARSVWILYPGTESRYFARDGRGTTDWLDRHDRPLDGVGAIPLRPEVWGAQDLNQWMVSALLATSPP